MIPKHLQIALSYLGEKEIPGKESNPFISECLKSVDMPESDEVAWCAAFVNNILRKAGILGTGKALARSYLTWGKEGTCKPGAIAVQARTNDPKFGHVSFVVQDNGTFCYCVGGNQSNAVTLAIVNKRNVLSFREVAI